MKYLLTLSLSLFLFSNCNFKKNSTPPMAKKIPTALNYHNDTIIDDYFWMRLSDEQKEAEELDEQTQNVIDYLNLENDYLESQMAETESFQKKLYEEFVSRIKQDDESLPVSYNGYTYYIKFEEGQDYECHYRKANNDDAQEELLLDIPKMAKGENYFDLGDKSISENNRYMAYSIDLVSRRQYTIHIKDLKTGEILEDKIENTTGSICWANDNKTIYYTKQDEVTLRSNKIFKHTLGTETSQDELVYEEKDETFSCYIYKTKSRKYLLIGSSQTLSTEYRFLDADNPDGEWQVFQARERNLEYSISHFEDHFYVLTNWDAKNFRLMKTSVDATSKENWKELISHREDVLINDIEIFKNYLVIKERKNGLDHLRVKSWYDDTDYYIDFKDPTYSLFSSSNLEFDTDTFRFVYTSLTIPSTVYGFNLLTQERTLLKRDEVLGGGFESDNYTSERLFATSRDGKTQIPISLVYKKGFEKNGEQPLLLYAYGSYGYSTPPYFSSSRLSLLDRGFAFAIAHIRGGQEMGRQWYEDGKLLKKMNTFYDFIDCANYLIDEKYTSSNHLYANGGSAGGLLMGAVINMAPDLWNGVIAEVPFVDVINTMWDESIPLTTGEFDEWGNPKDKKYYDYIKSYSPYDNVKAVAYPNMLITTGYWDSQVQYWEPAKWIAKLREYKTDDNLLMMYCNMDVGHGGASGRFKSLKEEALKVAFLLKLEGIKE
ncbi:MAG: S9 family peptidase [Flavobacteriales bacterium]|nr:S9 family peptidase [Flavobacteriales bacterium]